jgi:hypothetical protein
MLMGLFVSHAQYSRKVRDFRMGWGSTLYKSFSKVIQINLYNNPKNWSDFIGWEPWSIGGQTLNKLCFGFYLFT